MQKTSSHYGNAIEVASLGVGPPEADGAKTENETAVRESRPAAKVN